MYFEEELFVALQMEGQKDFVKEEVRIDEEDMKIVEEAVKIVEEAVKIDDVKDFVTAAEG